MMKLYNTLSKKTETLQPISAPQISLYTCGPTVYHYMHIGNLRKAIADDTLKRTLLSEGYDVVHVMNITDVGHLSDDGDEGDDKMENGAKREGKTAWEIAEHYTNQALEDYEQINILPASSIVKATDTIDDQIKFIQGLFDKGYAYQAELAVYFDTSKLPDYGKLTGQNLSEKDVGVREDVVVDPSKKNPTDFALWVFTKGKHSYHTMRWKSPWGEGFPGWHLECSAIIKKELGETIDIHTGGVDHIGTHHTNEIAQSEALHGKTLANYWVHSEFLHVDGQKMAKSLGNTYRLADLKGKSFVPLDFRMLVLQAHYRTQQNFTWDNLQAARNRLRSLQAMAALQWQDVDIPSTGTAFFDKTVEAIKANLSDDLNTPAALAELSAFESLMEAKLVSKHDAGRFKLFLGQIDSLFGLQLLDTPDIAKSQKNLIADREKARENKDWAKADRLRDKLNSHGITLRDTDFGAVWYRT